MKALLDTDFIRHLGLADGFDLIQKCTDKFGWKFIIPQAVVNELNRRTIDASIQIFMDKKIIEVNCCTNDELSSLYEVTLGLGDGELQAICIVNKCDDRTFKEYLILTDDKSAQKKSRKLGMSSHGIVAFLLWSNRKKLFDKTSAMNSLSFLENHGDYSIPNNVKSDFMKRLL